MKLSTRLIRSLSKPAYQKFVRDTEDPEGATERLFKEIWNEIGPSVHWQEHRPKDQPHIDDFELTTYKDYQSSIEKGFAAGESTLAKSRIVCWGQSSGTTTNIPKIYPITASYSRQMKAVNNAFTHTYLEQRPDFFFGRALFFVAHAIELGPEEKIDRAYMSNYGIRRMPAFAFNRSSVVPRSIYTATTDYFTAWAPLYALAGNVEYSSMILPATLHAFWLRIRESIDEYWPYLEGKKNLPEPLPRLHCSAQRLAHLKEVFRGSEPTIAQTWPNLHTLFSWRSGISQFQEAKLRAVLGDVPVNNLPYCSTEGYFTVPTGPDSRGGVVHPGANILEFMPANRDDLDSKLLKPWELKEGETYEMVITTAMGLVRYQLLDVVKCTGFFNRAPIIEFVCKSAHVVRLSMTNIFETNLAEALRRAEFKLDGRWIFGPNQTGDTIHLYVQRPEGIGTEWDDSEIAKQVGVQLERVDASLQEVNSSYGIERGTQDVSKPQLVSLPYEHILWPKADMITTKPRLLLSRAPDVN